MLAMRDKERRLAECFERGRHLASVEKNYDYAHAMFAECVRQDLADLEYTQALLSNLKAKFGNNKRKAAHLFRLAGERELRKAITKKDWSHVLRLGLEMLEADPWHVPTLRGMAQACESLHYNEVELAYLKQALDAAPNDVEVNRHCARSLTRMGQFDQAIACWHRVERITGGEREAAQMISRLAEKNVRAAPKGEGKTVKGESQSARAAEYQNSVAQSNSERLTADSLPPIPDSIPLSPRKRLERAIEEDSTDVANYLKLAELLCEMCHYKDAQRTLAKALENCVQEQLVRDALEQVQSQAQREAAEIERQKELRARRNGFRVPGLELALVTASMAVLFQLFPSWWEAVSSKVIEHARLLLILANVVGLVVMIMWRQRKG